MKLYLAHL